MSGPDPTAQAIGVDVGGTKIAAGVCASGQVLAEVRVETPGTSKATVDAMLRLIGRLRADYPRVAALGAGVPGLVTWPEGRIRTAPNNAFLELPLQELLARATGLPVQVDNDANVAAWAETRFGAAAGRGNVVGITVGTGIGGGLVFDGTLYRGASGLAGEPGHMTMLPGGPRCGCGREGCLEALASGRALGRLGRAAAAADPTGLLAALAGGPERVTGETVYAAATEGDDVACGLFNEIGSWLGKGLANLVTLLEPDIVVIGGGLVQTGELLLAPARSALEAHVFGRQHRSHTPVVAASLGPKAGFVGAADLALIAAK